jgi:hypothetical protein
MSEIQNVETSNSPVVDRKFESKSSFETPIIETVEVKDTAPAPIENEASSSPEAAPNEGGDGELPEFAKRRLGKEQKKYEREIARVKAELEQERARNNAPAQPQAPYGAQSPTGYQDPLTGKYIDTNTPEGQAIFNYQQELSQHLNAQERQQQERQQKEVESKLFAHFQDSFEDAKDKYSDFEKVITSSGMKTPLAQELANFPDPGELGYYLASNPREVDRLQKLPAYEMKRELARHMAEMVSKNNITRAPAPIKPTGSGAGSAVKQFAHKSIAELKAERKAQLNGTSGRRR